VSLLSLDERRKRVGRKSATQNQEQEEGLLSSSSSSSSLFVFSLFQTFRSKTTPLVHQKSIIRNVLFFSFSVVVVSHPSLMREREKEKEREREIRYFFPRQPHNLDAADYSSKL